MHLKTLKIFCDVVDRRSFSRAAEENGMSQSTISQMVHQLEERLGVQLLDRSTRPFVLTPEGDRYYDGCRQLVRKYEELEEEVRALHDAEARRLVVASIYSVGLAHMSAFMQRFKTQHPRAAARLEYLHPHSVYEAVDNGEVDFGLVSYPEETRQRAAIAWRTEPMVVVTHPEHPLAKNGECALMDLADEPFVAFERGLAIREQVERALAKAGVSVAVRLEFDNIETMKRAIEIDEGVSILPEPSVRREVATGTLAKVEIAGTPLARPLGIVHRRDRQFSALAEHFVDMLLADAEFAEPVSVNGGVVVRSE